MKKLVNWFMIYLINRYGIWLVFVLLLPIQSCYYFKESRKFDVVIYGSTSAGIVSAVQSVRMGKSVKIINPESHLGGLTTGGLGQTDIGNKMVIGGISRDFYQRIKE